jgi:hypothetical protein
MFWVLGFLTTDLCFVLGFIDLFMLRSLVVGAILDFNVVICLQSFISSSYLQWRHDALELGGVLKIDCRKLSAKDVK